MSNANWATVFSLTQPAGAASPADSTTESAGTGDAPATGSQGPIPCGSQGGLSSAIMMVAMIAVFYFLLIRPQSKKAKEHQKMLNALQKGDEVVTGGGIVGRISGNVGKDDKLVTLEISEKVRVRVLKSQIVDKFKG